MKKACHGHVRWTTFRGGVHQGRVGIEAFLAGQSQMIYPMIRYNHPGRNNNILNTLQ